MQTFEGRQCKMQSAYPRDAILVPIVIALSAGCAVFLPSKRDAKAVAETQERNTCPAGAAPEYPAELFDPQSVVSVKPLYTLASTARSGAEYRLGGAIIQLRPIPSLSSESIESLLNCHNARSELKRAGEPRIENDPYWVPGQPVDIAVRSERGEVRAEVKSSDVNTAQEILRRATAFGHSERNGALQYLRITSPAKMSWSFLAPPA